MKFYSQIILDVNNFDDVVFRRLSHSFFFFEDALFFFFIGICEISSRVYVWLLKKILISTEVGIHKLMHQTNRVTPAAPTKHEKWDRRWSDFKSQISNLFFFRECVLHISLQSTWNTNIRFTNHRNFHSYLLEFLINFSPKK
jgi:hypothetical protein